MTKVLRIASVLLLVLTGMSQKSIAQACSVKNLTIKVNSITSTSNSCVIKADISWIQDANGGNKFTNVHIWTSSSYPNPILNYSKPPTATDLTNTLGTIVIANPSTTTPTLVSKYQGSNTVKMIGITGATLKRTANYPTAGLDSFRVSNVTITLSGTNSCANNFILKGDVWSSQSNNDQTVQCASANGTFTTTDVTISGIINCTIPRSFQLLVATASATPVSFTYQVYADTDNSGSYSSSDPLVNSGSGTTVNTARFNSGLISYSNYPTSNLSVIVQVAGNPVAASGLISNGCSLPVKYKSFEASRENASMVALKWTTTMEQNNTGFEIQRKDGAGAFHTIQFVQSKSKDGNSGSDLSYSVKDPNVFEGMTQYRIVQIDLDGRRALSSIAVVNGKQGTGTKVVIYPNPAMNGNATIVFNNNDRKEIYISDMSGRIVKTASNLTTNSYQVTGLKSGMYIVKVVNSMKNEVMTEKLTAQ